MALFRLLVSRAIHGGVTHGHGPHRCPASVRHTSPPLQVSGKGHNLRTKPNEEGKKSQKTFPRFPLAGNTTSPKSQVLLSCFPSSATGPGPPRCCLRTARGAFVIPPAPQASRASDVWKPGGLSNHKLEYLSFTEAWDENLPWAALVLSHGPKTSVAFHPSLKKTTQNPLIRPISPPQWCPALEMMSPHP